jgi:hypothetical protein
MNLNRAIEFRIKEIETEMQFQTEGDNMDLINSRFVKQPFEKIEKSLA